MRFWGRKRRLMTASDPRNGCVNLLYAISAIEDDEVRQAVTERLAAYRWQIVETAVQDVLCALGRRALV